MNLQEIIDEYAIGTSYRFDFDSLSDEEKFLFLKKLVGDVNYKRREAEREIDELQDRILELEDEINECDRAIKFLNVSEIRRMGIRLGLIPVPGQLSLLEKVS